MRRGNSERLALLLISLYACLTAGCGGPKTPDYHLVKFDTLNRIIQQAPRRDGPVLYAHYQLLKDGSPAPAGQYGVGTVDDAARALLVYLRWQELTGDSTYAGRCDSLLNFILFMQADDGRWFRWLKPDGGRGGEGEIENPGLGNGAAKAVWALGRWYEVRGGKNSQKAAEVVRALERLRSALQAELERYPQMEEIGGLRVPSWLPNGGNSDVAAEMLLGLVAFRRAGGRLPELDTAIDLLTAGVAMLQQRQEGAFAYGAHFSYKNVWHGWSNAQVQALTAVHRLTGRREPLVSAQREADQFYPWLLKEQFADRFTWPEADNDRHAVDFFPQRAEHVRPVVLGCLALYDATGEEKYAKMAGRAARWLLGDNAAHEAVYDAATGAAKAWIKARNRVRPDVTAEAVSESLMMLMEVGRVGAAQKELLR